MVENATKVRRKIRRRKVWGKLLEKRQVSKRKKKREMKKKIYSLRSELNKLGKGKI